MSKAFIDQLRHVALKIHEAREEATELRQESSSHWEKILSEKLETALIDFEGSLIGAIYTAASGEVVHHG